MGGVTVYADNAAKLTAMTTNAATAPRPSSGGGGGGGSGNTAVGVTLAFNTIGWKSENVLFSAIDALLGDSLLADAFSGENPSNATATMLDTTVNASGQLTVSALDASHHHLDDRQHDHGIDEWQRDRRHTPARRGARTWRWASYWPRTRSPAVPRRASPLTPATSRPPTIQAAGGVSVTAQDSSGISATITLGSSTTAPGGSNSGGGTGVAGAVSLNDVRGGAAASMTNTTLSTTGGNVLVQAKEMATLTATTTSEVTAGSSSTPTTTSGSTTKSPLAMDGLIGTNLVQSAASATLGSSHVTTTGTRRGRGGVAVDAENTATPDGHDHQRGDGDRHRPAPAVAVAAAVAVRGTPRSA